MVVKELEYVGKHQVHGVVAVEEEAVDGLLATGDFVLPGQKVVEEPVVSDIVPDKTWKEKDIKKWIKERDIDVSYNIVRDTKKEILGRLKTHGHI